MDIDLLIFDVLRSLIVFSPIATAIIWAMLVCEETKTHDIW